LKAVQDLLKKYEKEEKDTPYQAPYEVPARTQTPLLVSR
jgi:hypothetical protein